MGKIATEGYVSNIWRPGWNESNKCCTKSYARDTLNCPASLLSKYADNQLVEESAVRLRSRDLSLSMILISTWDCGDPSVMDSEYHNSLKFSISGGTGASGQMEVSGVIDSGANTCLDGSTNTLGKFAIEYPLAGGTYSFFFLNEMEYINAFLNGDAYTSFGTMTIEYADTLTIDYGSNNWAWKLVDIDNENPRNNPATINATRDTSSNYSNISDWSIEVYQSTKPSDAHRNPIDLGRKLTGAISTNGYLSGRALIIWIW